MELPITTILASLSAIWLFVLSGHVIQQRRSAGVSLGAGDDPVLLRRTRAQANLTEYAPIFILMIGLSELQHGNAYVIATIASLFMSARLAHVCLVVQRKQSQSQIFGHGIYVYPTDCDRTL